MTDNFLLEGDTNTESSALESIALLIEYAHADAALQLASVLSEEYSLLCVFFYGKGVQNILNRDWTDFTKEHGIPLYACVNSLEKEKITCSNQHVAGLSTFIAYALKADHTFQLKSDEDIDLNYH